MPQLFTFSDIAAVLPRHLPLLMLDRAVRNDDGTYTAIKNITSGEEFFNGHFPEHPIVPGVLQVEAMKQLGELALRPTLDPEGIMDVYLSGIEKVKFRRPNLPGDRMEIKLNILEVSDRSAVLAATVSNAGGIASEAKMTMGVRPKLKPTAMPGAFDALDRSDSLPMDTRKIRSLMPHRFPFLLIDYVAELDGGRVVAVKNVSGNENCFARSTPDYMVLPESFLCEIGAQSGCASVLSRPENAGKIGYFMAIDHAVSLAPVFPGDRLVITTELPPGKSKFGKGNCTMTVDGREVFRSGMMFAIVEA